MRIQRWGVIEDATLEFAPGLNVVTGETGAGKTMVVSGIGLLFGSRADSSGVRAGAADAVVEGEVDLPPGHPALERAEQAGADVDDALVLVRTVNSGGRSRAHVGGRSAPVRVLSELGEQIVAVHGQADQWRLRQPAEHRALIDAAGGADGAAAVERYTQAHAQWTTLTRRLAEIGSADADRRRHSEMLRLALDEIERVDPQPGEEDELAEEAERLAHAEQLMTAARVAHGLVAGADDTASDTRSATALVTAALDELRAAGAHDPQLQHLGDRVAEVGYLLTDIGSELAGYAEEVELDPRRLEWVQQRRADLQTILRKYGSSSTEVLEWAQRSAAELASIDTSVEAKAALEQQVAQAAEAVQRAGAELTALRTRTASRLASQVTAELEHLAMAGAQVLVHLEPVEPQASGCDEVEIRLAANPGSPARSVVRAASGGELSRVMLALELAAAEATVPSYVFDEVDAGVGGAAALDLGARLARLGQHAQVIVVTHLGQVAAYADRHLVVRKTDDGSVTASDVREVSGPERVAEVARMLGGVSDSAAALRHAEELIDRHAPERLAT